MGNPMRHVAIWIGGQAWLLPHLSSWIPRLDLAMRKLTRGRITLLTFAGLPELFLTVPGRKSGIPRTTPLLCVPHEGGWLIAGSNWGQGKPPVWVGNLATVEESDATASIQFHGRHITVVPRRATGEERAELWEVMLRTWPNYAKYAARLDREIAIFRLTPAD